MLSIPTKGISRSVKVHNIDLDVFCDWIEGSVLFVDDEISASDIIDVLIEQNVYESESFAEEMIASAWTELKRRQACTGNSWPLAIRPNRITRTHDWKDVPAHSFCLVLSFAKWYRSWGIQFGKDYTEQGQLFEELTKISVERQLAGWNVHMTGWARTNTKKIYQIVEEVAGLLGETQGHVKRWTKPSANEAGLDLLCYRSFPDGRVGIPVYLMQCASGGDWEGKLRTPDLKVWNKIVDFAAKPRRAFATPFSFTDEDFVIHCNAVDGLLMDRYRLLAAGKDNLTWLPSDLVTRITAWLESRVPALPFDGTTSLTVN